MRFYWCLKSTSLVFWCRISVLFDTFFVLHTCFAFKEIKEKTIFLIMLILCCWLCAAISWKYSSLELRISATISFVISKARLSTFWMFVVFNAFSKVLGNVKLYFFKLTLKNVKGTVSWDFYTLFYSSIHPICTSCMKE